jgi:hypothetical protein
VKPIAILRHVSPEQVDRRFRVSRDPLEKIRWQVIWLLIRPGSRGRLNAVSKLVGLSPAWAAEILKRWNAHGREGLLDGRG